MEEGNDDVGIGESAPLKRKISPYEPTEKERQQHEDGWGVCIERKKEGEGRANKKWRRKGRVVCLIFL